MNEVQKEEAAAGTTAEQESTLSIVEQFEKVIKVNSLSFYKATVYFREAREKAFCYSRDHL